MSSPPLPAALGEAISRGRLLVFCGAGISMLEPSNLPSWWGFNQSILEEAKRLALEGFPAVEAVAAEHLRALSLDQLPVEAFSEILVQTFAGPHYFPVLEVLDSDRPNANHVALAELGRSGVATAFVTTNFDTLIEQAFRRAGVPLRVLVEDADYRTMEGGDICCELYKIHGSVGFASSLVDTVTQKLRGISLEIRGRLAALFRQHHVLVLGYSGADLSFGDDYLAFSAIDVHCPGITWLVQPGKTPSERVREVVGHAGDRGALIEGTLPDFFERLGVTVEWHAPALGGAGEAEAKMHHKVQEFFAAEHVGAFASAAFCTNLLWKVGDEAAADELMTAVSKHPEMTGDAVTYGAGVAFRTLARWAMRKYDFGLAVEWLNRELAFFRGIACQYAEAGIIPSRAAELETANNLAAIYINFGLCFLNLRDAGKAGAALEAARQYAEKAEDFGHLSLVYLNKAKLEQASGGHPDHVLSLLNIADALAKNSGMGQTLHEAKTLAAQTLIRLAEYDEALSLLRQAEPYVNLVGGLEGRLDMGLTSAEVYFRRGDMDSARRKFRECVEMAEARGSTTMADRIRFQFCRTLCFHPPFREEVLEELKGLMNGRAGAQAGSLPREQIERLLNRLLEEADMGRPHTELRLNGLNPYEAAGRRAVADCELSRDLARLPPLFKALCELKYHEQKPERMLHLARAFLAAAGRLNDPRLLFEALNLTGVARDLSGDAEGALDAYQEALETEAPSPEVRAEVGLNIALIKSKLGEDVEALFDEAIDAFRERGDYDNQARAMWGLAEHCARGGRLPDAIGKLEEALALCEGVEHLNAKLTIEARLAHLRQRLAAQPWAAGLEQDVQLILARPEEAAPVDREQFAAMRSQARSAQEIGNLALVAATSGLDREARELTEEALALYKEADDLLGLSRCWSNLAYIAARGREWELAVEHSKRALALRVRLEDIAGQILIRSNISLCCAEAGDYEQATEHASICLTLAEGRRPSRPVAVAWHVLASAHTAAVREAEARHAARRFVEVYPQIDAPELTPAFEEYKRLLQE